MCRLFRRLFAEPTVVDGIKCDQQQYLKRKKKKKKKKKKKQKALLLVAGAALRRRSEACGMNSRKRKIN